MSLSIENQELNDKIAEKMVALISDEIYPALNKELLSDYEIECLVDLFSECLKVDQKDTLQNLKEGFKK